MAVFLIGLLRYHKFLPIGLLACVLVWFLPFTQSYVQHFIAGVQQQDLATQMRMGEYRDAFILIARYPWFGVGFSARRISIPIWGYRAFICLSAKRWGLIGLELFFIALIRLLWSFATTWFKTRIDAELEPILLGTCLAVAGALVAGVLDHYLFNIDFPHAASPALAGSRPGRDGDSPGKAT